MCHASRSEGDSPPLLGKKNLFGLGVGGGREVPGKRTVRNRDTGESESNLYNEKTEGEINSEKDLRKARSQRCPGTHGAPKGVQLERKTTRTGSDTLEDG